MTAIRGCRRDPEASPFENVGNRPLQIGEGGLLRWRTHHENKVVAGRDIAVQQPNGFARTTLGTVAVVGLAELLADDEAAACAPHAVARRVHDEQRVRPGLSVATHPLKLLWSLQPLATPHAASNLTMSARYTTALIADRQLPAPFKPACFEHELTLARRHARQKAVLAAARNALGLPRSLGHECLDPLNKQK